MLLAIQREEGRIERLDRKNRKDGTVMGRGGGGIR